MRVLIIGGSDAAIEAGLSAAAAGADVTLLVADAFPNFSVCGIPYYLSGEVSDWRQLAHRDLDALQAAGLDLHLNTSAVRIDIPDRLVQAAGPAGEASFGYDRLIVATGAVPARPPIAGLDHLCPDDGVHVLHSMGDTLALADTLARDGTLPVVIVGGGYIGLEMAEALTRRGVAVTLLEALPQLMSTVDAEVAAEIRQTLERHGVRVHTETPVGSITHHGGALTVHGEPGSDGTERAWPASAVLVVTGVQPNTDLAAAAGLTLGVGGTIAVDRGMRTNAPDVFAAGDCVHTYHRLLDDHAYLPLGSTAHKQGRIAGINAVGGDALYAGSLGTQVVRVFNRVVAATGLRAAQAQQAGFAPSSWSTPPTTTRRTTRAPPRSGSGSPAGTTDHIGRPRPGHNSCARPGPAAHTPAATDGPAP